MLLPRVGFPNAGNSPLERPLDVECATRTRRGNDEGLPQTAMPPRRPTGKWCCPKKRNPIVCLSTGTTGTTEQTYKLFSDVAIFTKKRMLFHDFQWALSKPRIGRFLIASNNNEEKALRLYQLNIQCSQTIFGLLSIFEVALRNQIDYHYKEYFNDREWLVNQCKETGIFNHPSFSRYQFESRTKIQATFKKLGEKYNHDRLVAELSFGFWSYMFAPIQFKVGGQHLHKIYVNRPKGTTPKELFNSLDEIRSLRNRIAHHEPLCFDKFHKISSSSIQLTYQKIINHTKWLGFNPDKFYMGLDQTPMMIELINNEI